jgi:DNA replication and repair protein RecF
MTGSPEVRRKYFDRFLSSGDLEYKKRLTNYENALRKRNKVLETYRNDEQLKEELAFWNTYLEEQAIYVAGRRDAYCEFLNKNKKIDNKEFSIKYLNNELTKDKLKEMFEVEKRYRRTLIGPQKDDFAIYEETDHISKNLHHFGSRSEQRLGVFWLKLNEIGYLEKIFGKRPILLLDDIFSELDAKNKKLILDLIKKHQTVVTTTEIELLDLVNVPKSIIKL